jgi:hypothetical protein
MRRLATAQQRLAAALVAAYPDSLTRADAAAMTGAVVGALVATVADGLADPDTAPDELPRRAVRALRLVESGIAALPA